VNELWYSKSEIYIKERQAEYLEKANKYRLVQEAIRSSARPASWIEKGMLFLGSWLIARGESLQQRFVQKRQIPRFHERIKTAP